VSGFVSADDSFDSFLLLDDDGANSCALECTLLVLLGLLFVASKSKLPTTGLLTALADLGRSVAAEGILRPELLLGVASRVLPAVLLLLSLELSMSGSSIGLRRPQHEAEPQPGRLIPDAVLGRSKTSLATGICKVHRNHEKLHVVITVIKIFFRVALLQ